MTSPKFNFKSIWKPTHVYGFLQIWIFMSYLCHGAKVIREGYVEEYINTPELCPPVGKLTALGFLFKEKILLANFPNNTVIIKLSQWQERNSPSAHLGIRCTFEVTAPKNHGIMMTIRSLHLRKYPQSSSCYDYLKFKPERSASFTPHVCGEVDALDKSEQPQGLIGPRYVYDPHAGLDITIVTEDSSQNDAQQKPLQVELVLTATRACSISALRSGRLRQCTIKTPNSCIPADLFCDSYINCGIEGDFGDDERDCVAKSQSISRAMSVFIFGMTALGTLVTVAVLVLLICCCCRKCSTKSDTGGEERRRAEVPVPRSSESILPSTQRPEGPPSAPLENTEMLEWRGSIAPKAEAEDLPPSYKDLFPTLDNTIRR